MAVTISQALRSIRRIVPAFLKTGQVVLEDTAYAIKDRMNKPGKPITHPVNWDSEKQQAAFFASNGFGKGIPYSRKGDMQNAFQVTNSFGAVNLFAPDPAGAVFGSPKHDWWQSNIHKGRWQWLKTVYFEEISKIPARFRDRFRTEVG